MRIASLGIACVCALVACGGDDAENAEQPGRLSLAEALTRGVKFDNGLLRSGELPKADSGGERVALAPDLAKLLIVPGDSSLLPLTAENPDEDDQPVVATLMQFEDGASYIEVPIGSNTSNPPGEPTTLEIENPFEVESDICDQLCNRLFRTRMAIAVALEDGSISVHASLVVELDCREDGDEAACTGDEPGLEPGPDSGDVVNLMDGGELSDAATPNDAGEPLSDGGSLLDGSISDSGSTSDPGDAGPSAPPPQIALFSPQSTPANSELTLTIPGSGFLDRAVAYLDGQELDTVVVSDSQVLAEIPSTLTAQAGNHAVYVENVPGDSRTRSNILYLQVTAAPGAPTIYDYSPDNGVPGDVILIIASNLASGPIEIEDAEGNPLTPGTLGTISWPNAGSVDTVEVQLPSSIASGPITVSNSLGSFQGKIFSVGSNLTRLEGTVLEVSTEYNTAQWGRASGADNRLATSFFTAHGDCATLASCTTVPFFKIVFPSDQTVARIAFRGNREYASGYDFIRGRFEVLDVDDQVLWEGEYDLPAPDRDIDISLPAAVDDARAVRFISLEDESDEPGFSEFEVFGP